VPDHFLAGAPSVLFDCVVIAPAAKHADALAREAAAIDWIRDAFSHLKVIGYNDAATTMFERASVSTDADEGVLNVSTDNLSAFCSAAKKHRIWGRELKVRP
jgi:catalase